MSFDAKRYEQLQAELKKLREDKNKEAQIRSEAKEKIWKEADKYFAVLKKDYTPEEIAKYGRRLVFNAKPKKKE